MRSLADSILACIAPGAVLLLAAVACSKTGDGGQTVSDTSTGGAGTGGRSASRGAMASGGKSAAANDVGGQRAAGVGGTQGGRGAAAASGAGGTDAGGKNAGGAGGRRDPSAGTGGSLGAGGAAGGGAPDATAAWLLSYFGPDQSVAADSLYLAYSTDGLHWTRLGSGRPAYQLTGIGTNHIRDPFILRKSNGEFVYIATDWTLSNNDDNYWNNPSSKIFLADSKDLISFTNPRLLTLTSLKGPRSKAMHAWAPEAYYDPAAQQYAIIWSGNDTGDRNRIYVSYTKDFQTLVSPEPKVLFDPGYSVIDATVTTWKGSSYLFFKDETDNDGGAATGSGKDIQIAHAASESLTPGSFMRSDPGYIPRGNNQGTRVETEGPFVIKDAKQELWYLYADLYTQGGIFGCWSTTDLNAKPSAWKRLARADYSFPADVRHAHPIRITQAELDALVAHYK